jgi:hypothetical protein
MKFQAQDEIKPISYTRARMHVYTHSLNASVEDYSFSKFLLFYFCN